MNTFIVAIILAGVASVGIGVVSYWVFNYLAGDNETAQALGIVGTVVMFLASYGALVIRFVRMGEKEENDEHFS